MKIAILSDSPFFPTGYSNQAKLLAKYLSDKGHEVHFFANGYVGATIKSAELEDETKFTYTIYGQGKQGYFADTMSGLLKKLNIEKFIILLDTFMLHGAYGNPQGGWFLQIDTSPAETFFWFPTDGGGGMPSGCDLILRKVNVPIAMAKFGQKQVKDYYNLDVSHIPHGTEPERFYKLPEDTREEARIKWGLSGKFVIGVVARNQPRKMLDRTIKSLAIINKIKNEIPNVMLFMHMDVEDQAQVFLIHNLVKRFNLENRVVYSGVSSLKGFKWDEMNEIYNLFDVFLLTTSGEGFGIPIIESMSCEVPVLATDYTTTTELVKENRSGLAINLVASSEEEIDMLAMNMMEYDSLVMDSTITGSWEVERGLCSVKDAAEKIISLYKNPVRRITMGTNGRRAVLEKYDFNKVVGPNWAKVLGATT